MANEIYLVRGTAITWTDSGGDEVLDLGALAADGVRVGAYHDWGTGAQPDAYYWELDIDGFNTAPVVGEAVNFYLCESLDATLWTGPESPSDTSDGAGATNRLPNLKLIGAAIVRSTTAGDNLVASGSFQSAARYVSPVIHNNTADALLSTADNHELHITPVYYQMQ